MLRKNLLRATIFIGVYALVCLSQMTSPLGPYGNIPISTAGNTAVGTATIAANQLMGILTGTPVAAATYTTDTATNICSMFPFVGAQSVNNWNYDFYVKNTSAGANTITFAGGAGVTLVGTGTAAQNFLRHFKIVLNACPVPGTTSPTAAVQLISLETTAF